MRFDSWLYKTTIIKSGHLLYHIYQPNKSEAVLSIQHGIWVFLYFFFLVIDDAKKSLVSCTVLTYSIPDLHNTEKEENLTESTGVVSTKYPPNVKLENSSQLQSARAGVNYACRVNVNIVAGSVLLQAFGILRVRWLLPFKCLLLGGCHSKGRLLFLCCAGLVLST